MNSKFFYKIFSYLSLLVLFILFFSDLIHEPGLLPTFLICIYLVGCIFAMSNNILISLCVVALGINIIKIGSFYKMNNLGYPVVASDFYLAPYFLTQQKMLQTYCVEVIVLLGLIGIFIASLFFIIQKKTFIKELYSFWFCKELV